MSPGSSQDSTPDEPQRDGNALSRARRRTSVLLVEDDAAIAGSLAEALEEEGLHVATAANGREALQILRNGLRPSAIVLDLMMPVMDGWDFRGEQLRDPALKDIPVVVITATGFSAETIRMQFGKVGLLPKPVPYLDLLDMLRHPVGGSPPRPRQ
jgi:CheY-like chemotaxis protein